MNERRVYVDPVVEAVIRLYDDLFDDSFRRLAIRDQLDRQTDTLLAAHKQGKEAVAAHFTCWHPEWVGDATDAIMGRSISRQDGRETLAREYGFADWGDVERRGAEPPDPLFEAAVDALLAGDVVSLSEQLKRTPDLIGARSGYGHRATLLHYVGCNGVETHRQVVPLNLAEVAQLLLDMGADVNATAEMYGGDCTTIALLITSGFPAEAGVTDEVVEVLLKAGAITDETA